MIDNQATTSVEITTGRTWELHKYKDTHGDIPISKRLESAKIVHFQVTQEDNIYILLDNGKVYGKIHYSGAPYEWEEINWLSELRSQLRADEMAG